VPADAATKQTEENMLPAIPREQQLGILRKMLMIRRAEEHCIRFHAEHKGLIRGHFHVYIG
jgi:TPP-dependent pyruvate/acetoin dehydrogenase alpha subunit